MHIAGAGSSAGDVARPVTVSGQLRTSPAALPACRAVNWANTRARAGLGWADRDAPAAIPARSQPRSFGISGRGARAAGQGRDRLSRIVAMRGVRRWPGPPARAMPWSGGVRPCPLLPQAPEDRAGLGGGAGAAVVAAGHVDQERGEVPALPRGHAVGVGQRGRCRAGRPTRRPGAASNSPRPRAARRSSARARPGRPRRRFPGQRVAGDVAGDSRGHRTRPPGPGRRCPR